MPEETIVELGINPDDLWFIKIDNDINGPYEKLALKHFSQENETLFSHAEASQDKINWVLFSDLEYFKKPEITKHQGHFWIIENNQKSHPFSRLDLIKKIEFGEISLLDLFSTDDGHTWKKFHQCEDLKAYFQKKSRPPVCPKEAGMSSAEVNLHQHPIQENAANLAYIGQHQAGQDHLKLEEISVPVQNNIEVSRGLIWIIPSSVALICVVAYGAYTILTPSNSPLVSTNEIAEAEPTANIVNYKRPNRNPASFNPQPSSNRSALTSRPYIQENIYPESPQHHIEPAPVEDYPTDAIVDSHHENMAPEENNVAQTEPIEGQTVDASMGAAPEAGPPEQPVVEEASDF